MPILRSLNQRSVTDDEFHAIDRVVMSHAYDIQNKFGRLFDERVYENELAGRLLADGLEVHTQVPVTVSHGSFTKTYYLDLENVFHRIPVSCLQWINLNRARVEITTLTKS